MYDLEVLHNFLPGDAQDSKLQMKVQKLWYHDLQKRTRTYCSTRYNTAYICMRLCTLLVLTRSKNYPMHIIHSMLLVLHC